MTTFDITEDTVFSIGSAAPDSGAVYEISGIAFDYAVAGVPFLSAASDERPMERALADVQKQQIDQSQSPGEQSLSQWWSRAQADWSGGAGQDFMEPANDERVMRSFYRSAGVSPWTSGKLSLLRAHASQGDLGMNGTLVWGYGSSPKYSTDPLVGYVFGTSGFGLADGHKIVPSSDRLSVTKTALTGWVGSSSYRPVAAIGGGYVWAAAQDVTSCFIGTLGSTSLAANITGLSSTGVKGVWAAKGRMMFSDGPDLYALSFSTGAGGSVTIGSLSSNKISQSTAPDANAYWVGCAEAPGAILMAYHSPSTGSSIQKFTVSDAGGITTQTALTTVAEMPAGERIYSIDSYLGAYIVIVTNLGVRIGTLSDTGQLQYGPLSYEGQVCPGATGKYGSYYWVGVPDAGDSRTGLVRFDLSDVADDGRAPWAFDVRSSATNQGVGVYTNGIWPLDDDNLYFVTWDAASSKETLHGPTADRESSGWVESGWVRFGTLEDKTFHSLRLQAFSPYPGSVNVASVDTSGQTLNLYTFSGSADWNSPVLLGLPEQQRIRVRLTLNRSTSDATTGPTLDGWQLRALPSVSRQELIRVPLLCFDFERDQHGQQVGYEGFAYDRWVQLRDAARSGGLVNFQGLNNGEAQVCVVEDLSFQQVAPPTNASGFGGVLTVTVRTT